METRLKEVLAVVNNKGGVGKTTTVQSLAAALVRQNKDRRVLVVDLDPQCQLSILHGVSQNWGGRTVYDALRDGSQLPVYDTPTEGVFLTPASPKLQEVDTDLFRQMNPKRVLAKCFSQPLNDCTTAKGLTTVLESFDYVLIDCAPALSQSTYNAMGVASGLLIPVQMEGLAVNGLGNIMVAMKEVQAELNPNLELTGLLFTMVNPQLRVTKDLMDKLRASYDGKVCKTLIHRNVKIVEAQTMLKNIYDYKQWSTVANDYDELAKELFNE